MQLFSIHSQNDLFLIDKLLDEHFYDILLSTIVKINNITAAVESQTRVQIQCFFPY